MYLPQFQLNHGQGFTSLQQGRSYSPDSRGSKLNNFHSRTRYDQQQLYHHTGNTNNQTNQAQNTLVFRQPSPVQRVHSRNIPKQINEKRSSLVYRKPSPILNRNMDLHKQTLVFRQPSPRANTQKTQEMLDKAQETIDKFGNIKVEMVEHVKSDKQNATKVKLNKQNAQEQAKHLLANYQVKNVDKSMNRTASNALLFRQRQVSPFRTRNHQLSPRNRQVSPLRTINTKLHTKQKVVPFQQVSVYKSTFLNTSIKKLIKPKQKIKFQTKGHNRWFIRQSQVPNYTRQPYYSYRYNSRVNITHQTATTKVSDEHKNEDLTTVKKEDDIQQQDVEEHVEQHVDNSAKEEDSKKTSPKQEDDNSDQNLSLQTLCTNCGEQSHMVKDCPYVKSDEKEILQEDQDWINQSIKKTKEKEEEEHSEKAEEQHHQKQQEEEEVIQVEDVVKETEKSQHSEDKDKVIEESHDVKKPAPTLPQVIHPQPLQPYYTLPFTSPYNRYPPLTAYSNPYSKWRYAQIPYQNILRQYSSKAQATVLSHETRVTKQTLVQEAHQMIPQSVELNNQQLGEIVKKVQIEEAYNEIATNQYIQNQDLTPFSVQILYSWEEQPCASKTWVIIMDHVTKRFPNAECSLKMLNQDEGTLDIKITKQNQESKVVYSRLRGDAKHLHHHDIGQQLLDKIAAYIQEDNHSIDEDTDKDIVITDSDQSNDNATEREDEEEHHEVLENQEQNGEVVDQVEKEDQHKSDSHDDEDAAEVDEIEIKSDDDDDDDDEQMDDESDSEDDNENDQSKEGLKRSNQKKNLEDEEVNSQGSKN